MGIRGKVIYWDKRGVKQVKKVVNEEDFFCLEPNSIAFVTLEPRFQIPNYLALRFNLKIKHVYKGLLLGTGPLVDPGFEGKLSIPLHNLTANTYTFKAGEGLIQMEFTKLSSREEWRKENLDRKFCVDGFYTPNSIVGDRDVGQYINKAIHSSDRKDSIQSSIPQVMLDSQKKVAEAEQSARNAREFADSIDKRIRKWTFIGGVMALISLAGFFVSLVNMIVGSNSRIDNVFHQVEGYQREVTELQGEIRQQRDRMDEIANELKNMESINTETKQIQLYLDEELENLTAQ